MRYPEFLKKNDTIGYIAPSYGCNIEPYRTAFESAVNTFEEMGYKSDLGPNCFEGSGIGISNTPKACAKELVDYYCSDNNQILLSCGGGELMCETIGNVDFDKIKAAKPKWFMGYSDNTNFSFLLNTLCDVAAIYGPNAPAFGMEPWHKSLEDAYAILTGESHVIFGYDGFEAEGLKDEEHPLEPYNITEETHRICYPRKNMHMKGRLIGGCMDILILLLGTRLDKVSEYLEKYKDDGFIWFMESCDLNTMGIRRALWQMEQAGWFKYVKGFMFGRPLCHGSQMLGMDQYDAVLGILGKYHVPIMMDLDLGHIPPAMPIIAGSVAAVKMRGNDIRIRYDLV